MDNVRLNGSTVIVTGANTGIGKETARELARRGARVIMACRNQSRGDGARREIVNETGNNDVIVKLLDLGSLKSIKQFADDFNQNESRLNILVNNAGLVMADRQVTEDGFEMTFGVNHLGPFYLTYLLLDKLKQSAPSRIVTVSSKAHEMSRLNFDDLQFERKFDYLDAYGRSKTANVLFSVHLSKLLNGTGVTTYSLHPGTVETEISRNASDKFFFRFVNSFCGRCVFACFGQGLTTPEKGARTSLYCCLEPSIANQTGQYYEKSKRSRAKQHATDPQLAERLWTVSCQLCNVQQ